MGINKWIEELNNLFLSLEEEVSFYNCYRCGRCCRKVKKEYEIYITTLEAFYIKSSINFCFSKLSETGCIFLSSEGTCTIHKVRPLGCRVFFCDISPDLTSSLYEKYHQKIKDIMKKYRIPYMYKKMEELLFQNFYEILDIDS